jgi:molecular chaperone DnaK (HSP70)
MAKERLCGAGGEAAAASAVVAVQGMRVTIHQDELVRALEPVLLQTRQVVQSALEQFQTMMQQQQQQEQQNSSDSSMVASTAEIREVILIGGASAVPAVRQLLASLFPKVPELCVSVNAHSAVAQGCAIAAALASHHVPRHELESALMLDTSPHPIGVLTATDNFVEILPAQATLPAKGFATFTLADPRQRGVTVRAVERVWLDERYSDSKNKQKKRQQQQQRELFVPLGEFTFLLHRLPNHDPRTTSSRSVDIGMVLRTNGEFVVSIFDPNDPEHVRRKERARNHQSKGSDDILAFRDMVVAEEALSWEQILLMVACIVVFVLYVAAKLVFANESKILLTSTRGEADDIQEWQ